MVQPEIFDLHMCNFFCFVEVFGVVSGGRANMPLPFGQGIAINIENYLFPYSFRFSGSRHYSFLGHFRGSLPVSILFLFFAANGSMAAVPAFAGMGGHAKMAAFIAS
jgi:hypothetical protein